MARIYESVPLPKYIEIETSSYCNRKCVWCPTGNSGIRAKQRLMPWDLFIQFLEELCELEYKGSLAFHNYNEPLINKRLTKEIDAVKSILPDCKQVLFTNGDFLTKEKILYFSQDRISMLRVTIYPEELANSQYEKKENVIKNWLAAKDIGPSFDWEYREVVQGFAGFAKISNMTLEVINPNLLTYNWRGGTSKSLNAQIRNNPCHYTTNFASIDYEGRFKMCCNVFPDTPGHEDFVIGSLQDNTFYNLWNSERIKAFRQSHAIADFSKSHVCAKCSMNNPFSANSLSLRLRAVSQRDFKMEWVDGG